MTELILRGVRGSYPSAGPKRERYGVATTSLEVALGPARFLLVDCGTGLASVEDDLPQDGTSLEFHVLITHVHLDHLLGLPFFTPLYRASSRFVFHGRHVRAALESLIGPPFFPVPLRATPCRKEYRELDGPLDLGPVRVRHADLHHPQGVTAYRLDGPSGSVLFATDYERGDAAADERFVELGRGVDTLVHDAQYTPEEYDARRGWGHSTWLQAVEAARSIGARRLVLFHHDPRRTDDEIDRIVAAARREFPATEAAVEGMRVPL